MGIEETKLYLEFENDIQLVCTNPNSIHYLIKFKFNGWDESNKIELFGTNNVYFSSKINKNREIVIKN